MLAGHWPDRDPLRHRHPHAGQHLRGFCLNRLLALWSTFATTACDHIMASIELAALAYFVVAVGGSRGHDSRFLA